MTGLPRRVTNIAKQRSRKVYPLFKELETSTEYETEHEMKEEGLIRLFSNRIASLELLETSWKEFIKYFEELLHMHLTTGCLTTLDFSKEYAMAKSGSTPPEKLTKEVMEEIHATTPAEMEAAAEAEAKRRGEARIGAPPVKEENTESVELKIELTNSKGDKLEPIKMDYYVPITVKLGYGSSLLNDRDGLSNDFSAAYFGYTKKKAWNTEHYAPFIVRVCEAAKRKLAKEGGFNKEMLDRMSKSIDNLQGALQTTVDHIFDWQIADREKEIYGKWKDISPVVGKIEDMLRAFTEIKGLPEKVADIRFKHTYKVINPEKLISHVWYFNPKRFMDKLIELNKSLPREKRKVVLKIEARGSEIYFEDLQDFDAIDETIKLKTAEIKKKEEYIKREEDRIKDDFKKLEGDIRSPFELKNNQELVKKTNKVKELIPILRTHANREDIFKTHVTFKTNVTKEKNDFTTWLRGDANISIELYKEIREAKTPEELASVLELALTPQQKLNAVGAANGTIGVLKKEIERAKEERDAEEKTKSILDKGGAKKIYDALVKQYSELEEEIFKNKYNDAELKRIGKETNELLPQLISLLNDIWKQYWREGKGKNFPFLWLYDIKYVGKNEHKDYREKVLKGEIIPGYDENGWPLEVTEDGVVLIDTKDFDNKSSPRGVEKKFVTELDVLTKVCCMHNEFDAVRKDMRYGCFHLDSLTIIDYIKATKRVVAERWRVPQANKEWRMIGVKKLLKDDDAEGFRHNIMKLYDGNETWAIDSVGEPTDLNPAFDKRILKDRREKDAWFKHIGRKYYYYNASQILEQVKNFTPEERVRFKEYIGPCITTRGVSVYIIEQLLFGIKFFDDVKDRLKKIAAGRWYDYGPRALGSKGPSDPFDNAELNRMLKEADAAIKESVITPLPGE